MLMQVETGSFVSDASGRPAAVEPASILGMGVAYPPFHYSQNQIRDAVCRQVLGPDRLATQEADDTAARIERLFAATGVRSRQSVVDFERYYRAPRTTGERMAEYARRAYPLARQAVEQCLAHVWEQSIGTSSVPVAETITDLIVVSCTGYVAPGLDVQLARDLGMARDVRRVVVGHMGCFGALVGLRQGLAALAAHRGARVLLVCVELCSLHFAPTLDAEALTSFALFGDAAAALVLGAVPRGEDGAPAVLDTYCAADFESAGQMSWTITDAGFIMGLSPRVPITLRRNVRGVVDCLLAPRDLALGDISHWIIHPGGPSILDVIAKKLELCDEQMAPSWQALAEHGNCSSATVLLILERMLREDRAKPGEWGVMMAFGPGLTLETALLRF